MIDFQSYTDQWVRLWDRANAQISTIKPSQWTEKKVVMGKPRPGPFRYSYTPYAREPIDCLAPDHPARIVTVMKGSQIGFSSGVLMPGMGWMIENNPGNCYLMVGAPDLVDKSMEKFDLLIDSAGLRDYIKPQVKRRRSNKSGDTNDKKDFAGGYVFIGNAGNHKAIAQVDLDYILLDDLDAMKASTKESGDFTKLIQKRAAARKDTYKFFRISTPLTDEGSLIKPLYLAGDQRRYFIQCPCCHDPIVLEWKVDEGQVINPRDDSYTANNPGGMFWSYDNHDSVKESSVGYICYKCAGFFTDKNKFRMLNEALWTPTAIPRDKSHWSYHISSLYAPVGMFDWLQCAKDYVEANPLGQEPDQKKMQVFNNTVLGLTHKTATEAPKATEIQNNLRSYSIGTIPESLSIRDGNGRIVLLTMATDCNGVKNDARIDWELLAHAESGATYSVAHGSVGTFIPRENTLTNKVDREKYTYELDRPNSVWPLLEEIAYKEYKSDTGYYFSVNTPCIDLGHMSEYVWAFIDYTIMKHSHNPFVGIRGDKEEKYNLAGLNSPYYAVGKQRSDSYFVQVGMVKDLLSSYMKLTQTEGERQLPNFMNFPTPDPENKLYISDTYFSHFEAEHREITYDADGAAFYRWVKKNTSVQNHFWDVRVYGLAIKIIIVRELGKLVTKGKEDKTFDWVDYVNYVLPSAA